MQPNQCPNAELPGLLIPFDTDTFGPMGVDRVHEIASYVACIVVVRDHGRPAAWRSALCAEIIDAIDIRTTTPSSRTSPTSASQDLSAALPSSRCLVGLKDAADIKNPWPPEVSGWHLSASAMNQLMDSPTANAPGWSATSQLARHDTTIIGASCHSRLELRQAKQLGATYATLSPFFPSLSKPGYAPSLSLAELGELIAEADIPIFALGGVTSNNSGSCFQLGAYGVSAVGALSSALSPGEVAHDLVANSTLP